MFIVYPDGLRDICCKILGLTNTVSYRFFAFSKIETTKPLDEFVDQGSPILDTSSLLLVTKTK